MNTGRASNTGQGSDIIVLIEAGASIRGNTVYTILYSAQPKVYWCRRAGIKAAMPFPSNTGCEEMVKSVREFSMTGINVLSFLQCSDTVG